jgi:predicted SAM-dependent methyltransferase
MRKIHLGCGPHRIEGWENYDREVDLTKPLPFENQSVDLIFAEHVIENIPIGYGLLFLFEAKRVLKRNGVLRLAFPDPIEIKRKIRRGSSLYDNTPDKYVDLMKSLFSINRDLENSDLGLVFTIIGNQHQAAYTKHLMTEMMRTAGFRKVKQQEYLKSDFSHHLINVEQHWKSVGRECAEFETTIIEAVA